MAAVYRRPRRQCSDEEEDRARCTDEERLGDAGDSGTPVWRWHTTKTTTKSRAHRHRPPDLLCLLESRKKPLRPLAGRRARHSTSATARSPATTPAHRLSDLGERTVVLGRCHHGLDERRHVQGKKKRGEEKEETHNCPKLSKMIKDELATP